MNKSLIALIPEAALVDRAALAAGGAVQSLKGTAPGMGTKYAIEHFMRFITWELTTHNAN